MHWGWALFALPLVAQATFPDNYRRQNASTSDSVSATSSRSSSLVSSSTRSSSSSSSISISSTRSSSSISSTTTTSSSSTTTISTSIVSSSSSSSLSTSSVPSSSSSSKTSAFVPPPTTTAEQHVSPDIVTTSEDPDSDEQPTTSPTSGPSNVAAASKGFWGNKGAVAGTFTVVSLVIVGILVLFFRTIHRRQQESRNSARDTFFDTKGPVAVRDSANASMVSLGNEAMDPHAAPIPNYGGADHYLVDTNEYNYPPSAPYNPNAAQQQYYDTAPQQQYYAEPAVADTSYEVYNQYYTGESAQVGNTYGVSTPQRSASISPHPYSHPAHTSGAPPSAMRPFVGREARDSSAYQQSIDSFYGASGTAL
ncbi:hypothetical protein C8F01DRAFT_1364800 [Mycena amicta]|nr:hypothetical protein C8F01DRAFT_1364800 [Mycena amicta]